MTLYQFLCLIKHRARNVSFELMS